MILEKSNQNAQNPEGVIFYRLIKRRVLLNQKETKPFHPFRVYMQRHKISIIIAPLRGFENNSAIYLSFTEFRIQ
jgi:hypothetical protein